MAVKRNDPCPCGSGKKYKNCCLKKEEKLHVKQQKEERFYRQKHLLVEKMNDFFDEELSLNQYSKLQKEFGERINVKLPEEKESGFLRYWLYFFHRFENGLRGIEQFYEASKHHLTIEEKEMAEGWMELSPKLVQVVNKSDSCIMFEDIYTKEQFPTSDSEENIPQCIPWCGTYSLIEPFQDQYYFNGVSVLGSPKAIQAAAEKADELMKQFGLSHMQVLQDFYPEILAEFIDNNHERETIFEKSPVFSQYTLNYHVKDEQIVLKFLREQDDMIVDKWNSVTKSVSCLENWKIYLDNEISGHVLLADLFGEIELKNDQLFVTCYDEQHVDKVKRRLTAVGSVISLENEEVNDTETNTDDIKNKVVKLSQHTPEYFGLYAQSFMELDVDYPIPGFDGLSIGELVENDKFLEAEIWLRQQEYQTFLRTGRNYKGVEITADFNTVRNDLGLSPSPFVSGGKSRKSSIELIEKEKAYSDK